jgi:hypothetical protein
MGIEGLQAIEEARALKIGGLESAIETMLQRMMMLLRSCRVKTMDPKANIPSITLSRSRTFM